MKQQQLHEALELPSGAGSDCFAHPTRQCLLTDQDSPPPHRQPAASAYQHAPAATDLQIDQGMPQGDCRPAWEACTLEHFDHPYDHDATQAYSQFADCMTGQTHTADQDLLATKQVSSQDKPSLS